MEVKEYCDSLNVELSGWKTKIDDIVRKLDRISSGDKEKVVPMVNELHIFTTELGDRIEKLQKECPTNWEPEKIDLESKFSQLRIKWDEVSENIAAGDIGG